MGKKDKVEASGDVIQGEVSNVSGQAQVAIGKQINQMHVLQQGLEEDLFRELREAIAAEANSGSEDVTAELKTRVDELETEIMSAEPDLERIEESKGFLEGRGGQIAAATKRLFANEQVQAILRHAAEIAAAAMLKRLGVGGLD